MKRKIWGAACIMGLMIIIGTAGAMDADTITFSQGVGQAVISLIMFGGAGKLGGFID